MYLDYFNAVLSYYREGKRNATLPQRLMNPTEGSLKDECLSKYEAGSDKKDLRTLDAFFKVENDEPALRRAMRLCERDRFKPLIKLLRGGTSRTDHVNIELLAWLINFPDRPFKDKYVGAQKEEEVLDNGDGVGAIKKAEETDSSATLQLIDKPREIKSWIVKPLWVSGSWRNVFSIAAGLLVFALLSFYLVNRETPDKISDIELIRPIDGPTDLSSSNTSLAVRNTSLVYARCTGSSPCKACSNCSSCNYCNSGGTCGKCVGTKKAPTQKRAAQCQATTKKGAQCKRAASAGSKYCWQHS